MQVGTSPQQFAFEKSASREEMLRTPRSGLDSLQKQSRLASAANHKMNSSQAQLECSPKMGDITNRARQQSQVDVFQDVTKKALSFKQFKNHHRATMVQCKEGDEGKSSYEEVIRSEIGSSDNLIEGSDE